MSRRFVIALAALALSVTAQAAEVPHYVNFQSVLRDDSGNLIEDGFIDMQLRILDQDKDVVYEETQPGVQIVRSAINVMIGEGVVPGSSSPTGGIPVTVLDPEKGSHFLEIQFGSNQPSDAMELGSVPYAMYAERALGLAPNIMATEIPDIFVTEDELATAEADDLTTSTAFGGNPSSDVTGTYDNLQLKTDSIGSNEISSNAVGASEISDGSITTSDLNSGSFSGWDQDESNDLLVDGSRVMAGNLDMGGNNITNAGNVFTSSGHNINNHEIRIAALESEPPAASARAWVNWSVNGSGVITIISSFNVSGVANGGNTDFAITFAPSMGDALYMMSGSGEDPSDLGGGGAMMIGMNTSKNTASTAYIKGVDKNGNLQYNNRNYRVVFYR